jgi:hypothetical protein
VEVLEGVNVADGVEVALRVTLGVDVGVSDGFGVVDGTDNAAFTSVAVSVLDGVRLAVFDGRTV